MRQAIMFIIAAVLIAFSVAVGLAQMLQGIIGGKAPAVAAWKIGFNFRNTANAITDGANETYVLPTDAYPTTRGGVTFGYESGNQPDGRDMGGSDPHFYGRHKQWTDGAPWFKVTLPSTGNYIIRYGATQNEYGSSTCWRTFYDNTTELFSVTDTGHDPWITPDAYGTAFAVANWAAGNVAHPATFATTAFRTIPYYWMNQSYQISHIYLEKVN